MAYVRDDKTGKFTWVEGPVSDEGDTYDAPGQQKKSGTSPKTLLLGAVILGVVALLGVWGMRYAKEPGVAISRIHRHPAEFDGRTVTLRGRITNIFPVGNSYAYYLLQGQDTIVVFTRGSRPTQSGNAEVRGSISIGYLDGAPRPTLFAAN